MLSSANDTFVGSGEAAGLLTVQNGAETYTLGTFYIGGLAAGGTAGTVVVTGSGSVLSAPTLSIGSLSGGLLSVEAGASATGTSTTIDSLGELQIDAQSTFTGAITLAGGILDAAAAQGGSTAGTVALANAVTVTGSGSQLQSDGPTLDLTGLVSGSGNLTINSGVVELDDASNSLTGTIANFADLVLGNATAGGTATVAFTAGLPSQLTVAGTASPGVTVTGFGSTNVIDLEGLTFVAGLTTATVTGNRIVVTDGASTETIKATGLTSGATYRTQADASGGTEIVACYCTGTLVLTERGEAFVEDLAIGDRLVTATGLARPVRWIGRRSYAGRFLAANPTAHPMRFLAGSLGDGLPRRDLLVSPEHAMFLDGVLIPARHLVNGMSIVRERGLGRVDYFHVELDSHDVILAEGAPSESFMDDNSRGMFHNAAEFAWMYPDAALPDGYCARRVEHGAELEAIRQRLTVVAGQMAQAA